MANPTQAATREQASLRPLLALLASLVRRPRWRDRIESEPALRVGRGQPVIWLVAPDDDGSLLTTIGAFLGGFPGGGPPSRRPRRAEVVPRALLTLPAGATAADPLTSVREILIPLAQQLATGANAAAGDVDFRRLSLVSWLLDREPPATGVARPEQWRPIRDRDVSRRRDADGSDPLQLVDAIPHQLLAVLLRFLAVRTRPWLFKAKAAGLVPWAGAEYRWARRQRSRWAMGSFLAFAGQLGGGVEPDRAVWLLTDAFLSDLAAAYRRRPWRPAGARRTAYPVVLLDGADEANGGCRLLAALNEVRDDRDSFDPLLVVVRADSPPPEAGPVARPLDELPAAAHGWGATGRNLVLRVPTGPGGTRPTVPAQADRTDPPGIHAWPVPLRLRRPPLWSRAWVAPLACLLVLGAAGLTGWQAVAARVRAAAAYRAAHCGLDRGAPDAESLLTAGNECVGLTAGGHAFQKDDRLADVIRAIGTLNSEARRAHRTSPRRPFITVCYIGVLSKETAPTDPLTSRREALEGIAAAQLRQLNAQGETDPIVQVLIGNAGENMSHGVTVAELLGARSRRDPSIVGVVGLDQSRDPTVKTIKALTRHGIPMVAATLSADPLPTYSPMYYQIAPNNDRAARFMAAHVDQLRPPSRRTDAVLRRLIVVRSGDETDTYSVNLAADIRTAFARYTLDRDLKFEPSGAHVPAAVLPERAGSEVCGYSGVVAFAGRSEDFASFIKGVDQGCGLKADRAQPYIIAGDDVSEHVADAKKRAAFPRVAFDFVSFAIGSLHCGGTTADTANLDNDREALAGHFGDIFGGRPNPFALSCADNDHDPSLDGHSPLAYDAVLAYVNALRELRTLTTDGAETPINAGTVWGGLRLAYFDGASGRNDFRLGPVTPNKQITVLTADGGNAPTPKAQCPARPNGPPCPAQRS